MNNLRITSINRPVDLKYPTNRAIALLAAVVMIGGAIIKLLTGLGWLQSGLWGLGAGITVFFAWAICRELDPDHDLSAFVAASLALLGLFFLELPGLLALLWLLVVIRVVNRTPGLPATVFDSLAVLALGGWLSYQGNWGYAALATIGFLLDGYLKPAHRRQLVFAVLGALITVLVLFIGGQVWGEGGSSLPGALLAIGLSIMFIPVILGSRRISSVGDVTGEPLEPVRVQAGQILALLLGVQAGLWGGISGLEILMPLWAAILGAATYRLFLLIKGNALQ